MFVRCSRPQRGGQGSLALSPLGEIGLWARTVQVTETCCRPTHDCVGHSDGCSTTLDWPGPALLDRQPAQVVLLGDRALAAWRCTMELEGPRGAGSAALPRDVPGCLGCGVPAHVN